MSSASSPIQYSNVLTCLSSLSLARPDASRNCSNLRFQRGHSSRVLKSNGEGGCRRMLAITLLTPCTMSHTDWFTLLGKTQQLFRIYAQNKEHCYRNSLSLHSTQHIMVVCYIYQVTIRTCLQVYATNACSLTTNETIDISYVKSLIPDSMNNNKFEKKQTNDSMSRKNETWT